MARFDLYRRADAAGYLLTVQHELLDNLPTRVVVPVLPVTEAPPPIRDLNPQVEIDDVRHTIFPQYLAAIPKRELGRRVETSKRNATPS